MKKYNETIVGTFAVCQRLSSIDSLSPLSRVFASYQISGTSLVIYSLTPEQFTRQLQMDDFQ